MLVVASTLRNVEICTLGHPLLPVPMNMSPGVAAAPHALSLLSICVYVKERFITLQQARTGAGVERDGAVIVAC